MEKISGTSLLGSDPYEGPPLAEKPEEFDLCRFIDELRYRVAALEQIILNSPSDGTETMQ